MFTIVIALLLCAGIAAFVVALVLIPARREGRDVLTSRGEDLVASIRETSGNVVDLVTPGRSEDETEDAAQAVEEAPTSRPATGA
jgi:hypothetical protein